jgi:two-component system chemotaxis response regulator CheY
LEREKTSLFLRASSSRALTASGFVSYPDGRRVRRPAGGGKREESTMAKRFLIVDDSASMRQLVSSTIKDAGYDVVVAENGKDALGRLAGEKVDMVITDLNMPEMDGIELIKKLRTMPDYKFAPIVMLTTEAQETQKQEGKQAGASGWIVKPFSPEQLLDVVRKFVK